MSEVLVKIDQRVATITLNAPDRRNSLTLDMVAEIVAAFDQLENGDVGAVIVTGAGPAFCAGATLGHLGASAQSDSGEGDGGSGGGGGGGRAGLKAIYEGFLRVGRSPLPTLAAVNGAAVGAGMNLALACDVRLAGRSARFDTRFMQLGLHPGGGHTWMLQRVTGPQTAAAAVLFGEVLDGTSAAGCGLAWRCVDDDALMTAAQEMAARAAAAPAGLSRRTKQTLAQVASLGSVDEAVDVEIEAQLWSMAQPDFAERLAALQAKIRTKPATP
jgi:enoyl-CoA hydratase